MPIVGRIYDGPKRLQRFGYPLSYSYFGRIGIPHSRGGRQHHSKASAPPYSDEQAAADKMFAGGFSHPAQAESRGRTFEVGI